jgi:exoribonuclease R
MTRRILRLHPPPPEPRADAGFARIRAQFEIPEEFPADVLTAAARAAARPLDPGGRTDMRAVEFFTVDPPGSLDLDQAMHLERRDGGYRVRYAIADVGAFVDRGGVIEAEAWRRGETVYCPDIRIPLYPTVLSEGAASLLPNADRPAVVFTIDVDAAGVQTAVTIERAQVRSRAKLDYEGLAGDRAALLQEVGELRQKLEIARGGVQLQVPEQTVVHDPSSPAVYRIELERRVPSEDWNAQISLLAGMAAAHVMLDHHVGLLRTMEGVDQYRLGVLRRSAGALEVPWPADMSYGDFARSLDPSDPREAALLNEARGVMGHAGYVAFNGQPPAQPLHAALATTYAHSTAPMRRLADRYVLDLLVELCAGASPTPTEVDALSRLPGAMAVAGARIGQLERTLIDEVEVRTLQHREGERFTATVTDVDKRGAHIWIADPVVKARLHVDPAPTPGSVVQVRLVRADVVSRSLQFTLD